MPNNPLTSGLVAGSALARGLAIVGSFGLYAIVGRTLGAGPTGNLIISMTAATVVGVVVQRGRPQAFARAMAGDIGSDRTAGAAFELVRRQARIDVGLGLAVTACVTLPPVAQLASGQSTIGPIGIFGLGLFATVRALQTTLAEALRGSGMIGRAVMVGSAGGQLPGPLGAALAVLLVWIMRPSGWEPVLLIVSIAQCVNLLPAVPPLRRGRQQSDSNSVHSRSEIATTGHAFLAANVSGISLPWLGMTLLSLSAPADAVGQFAVALKLAALVATPLQILNAIIPRAIANAWALGHRSYFDTVVSRSTLLSLLGGIVIALPMVVMPGTVLGSAFGAGFVKGSHLLVILAIGQCVAAAVGPVGLILSLTDLANVYRNILLLTTTVGATFIAISAHVGPALVGVALATTLAASNGLAAWALAKRRHVYTLRGAWRLVTAGRGVA